MVSVKQFKIGRWPAADSEQDAQLLAIFLNVGRVIIERNQSLINDRLANQPALTTLIAEWIDGGTLLRTMRTIYYSEDCLACHGNLKGILDISGYSREGVRMGELDEAGSIQIPSDHR